MRACVAERFWQRAPTKAEAYNYSGKTTTHHSRQYGTPHTTQHTHAGRARASSSSQSRQNPRITIRQIHPFIQTQKRRENGKQIHTVYTYLGGDVHLHTHGKRVPNPTNESVARFNSHHPSESLVVDLADERDERTRKKKAINPGVSSPTARERSTPAIALARAPARERPRAVLSTRIARRDPPTNARNECTSSRRRTNATRVETDGWDE